VTLVGSACRLLARTRQHDGHEIEQIARDHEAPRAAVQPADLVVAQELAKRARAELDGVTALGRRAREELFPEV